MMFNSKLQISREWVDCKSAIFVIPAEAGIQAAFVCVKANLDAGMRRHDKVALSEGEKDVTVPDENTKLLF